MTKRKKVQLLANDKAGVEIDWGKRIQNPEDWFASHKYDGCRLELEDGKPFSRVFNLNPSLQIREMTDKLFNKVAIPGIVEAEFWAPGMNFSEVSHFFKAEDVTSEKSKKKYLNEWNKTKQGTATYTKTVKGELVDVGWGYPGRTPEWLATWHKELGFYAFDHVIPDETRTKEERYEGLKAGKEWFTDDLKIILQRNPKTLQDIFNSYQSAIQRGGEGLVIMKKKGLYKYNRLTVGDGIGFKMKENNIEFEGVILEVEEGTIAKDGAEKTVNAFGNSKTSQLAEDRIPSGLSKGFLVLMDDGQKLTVSLRDFDHSDRRLLLEHPGNWIGKRIMFTGSNPVKIGGKPRHAFYNKES